MKIVIDVWTQYGHNNNWLDLKQLESIYITESTTYISTWQPKIIKLN